MFESKTNATDQWFTERHDTLQLGVFLKLPLHNNQMLLIFNCNSAVGLQRGSLQRGTSASSPPSEKDQRNPTTK